MELPSAHTTQKINLWPGGRISNSASLRDHGKYFAEFTLPVTNIFGSNNIKYLHQKNIDTKDLNSS